MTSHRHCRTESVSDALVQDLCANRYLVSVDEFWDLIGIAYRTPGLYSLILAGTPRLAAAALFSTCRSENADPADFLLDVIVRSSYRVRSCAS